MAVNIITAVYNTSPRLFHRAMSSISAQTAEKYLVTVIDDHSAEENAAIYKKILDKFLFKSYFIRLDKNVGPGAARQAGIDLAIPGVDYVMFLDADDILMPRAVEQLYSEAKLIDADMGISNILVEGEHRTSGGIMQMGSNATWLHGKIYKKDFLKKYDICFPKAKIYNEDVYFNQSCLALAEKKFSLDESLYIWSYNRDSITRKDTSPEEFEVKYNLDYLTAQCLAIGKILSFNKKLDITGVVACLYGAYQYEKELIENKVVERENTLEEIKGLVKSYIYGDRLLIEILQTKEYRPHLFAFVKIEKNGLFFKQSLVEWVKEFIGVDMNGN